MAGPLRFYSYRISARRSRQAGIAVAIALTGILIKVAAAHTLSAQVKGLLVVAGAAALGLVLAWSRRSATITSRDGIAVQGLLRAKRLAWRDIQDIRVEVNYASAFKRSAPKETVIVYDRQGKRTGLPHLDQVTLADRGLALEAEVEHLRGVWQQLRGEDWVAAPDAIRKSADRARFANDTWAFGCLGAVAAGLFATVLMVIGLASGADSRLGAPWSWVFSPSLVLILPVAAFGVITVTAVVKRIRQRP